MRRSVARVGADVEVLVEVEETETRMVMSGVVRRDIAGRGGDVFRGDVW